MNECPFCRKIANGDDEHGPVYRLRDYSVVRFEPLDPVTEGHMLFVPCEHVADAAEHPKLTGILFAQAAAHGLLMAEPFNLITSVGSAATQTVQHLHVHYVPRRDGDGLPLPWTHQGEATIEVGGQVMTQAQFDAARYPLLNPAPGPVTATPTNSEETK